jgi:hypothetical protein
MIVILLVFLLKERITVKTDGLVCHTAPSEDIADGFRHEQHDLRDVPSAGSIKPRTAFVLPTMVGKMYVKAPVNSNIMTTTVTVIRVIPLTEKLGC